MGWPIVAGRVDSLRRALGSRRAVGRRQRASSSRPLTVAPSVDSRPQLAASPEHDDVDPVRPVAHRRAGGGVGEARPRGGQHRHRAQSPARHVATGDVTRRATSPDGRRHPTDDVTRRTMTSDRDGRRRLATARDGH